MCWSTRYSAHGAPGRPKTSRQLGSERWVGGAVWVIKMIFLGGEIVVSRDNLGAEAASACLSTETKIACSHVFVDEMLGAWRARSPPKTAASCPFFRIFGPIFGLRGQYLGDETSSENSIEH